jgi:hypothetical protein
MTESEKRSGGDEAKQDAQVKNRDTIMRREVEIHRKFSNESTDRHNEKRVDETTNSTGPKKR